MNYIQAERFVVVVVAFVAVDANAIAVGSFAVVAVDSFVAVIVADSFAAAAVVGSIADSGFVGLTGVVVAGWFDSCVAADSIVVAVAFATAGAVAFEFAAVVGQSSFVEADHRAPFEDERIESVAVRRQ